MSLKCAVMRSFFRRVWTAVRFKSRLFHLLEDKELKWTVWVLLLLKTTRLSSKSVPLGVWVDLRLFTRGLLQAIQCACVCTSPLILSCICERTEIQNSARDSKFDTQIYKLQTLFKPASVPVYHFCVKGCRIALIYICTWET